MVPIENLGWDNRATVTAAHKFRLDDALGTIPQMDAGEHQSRRAVRVRSVKRCVGISQSTPILSNGFVLVLFFFLVVVLVLVAIDVFVFFLVRVGGF